MYLHSHFLVNLTRRLSLDRYQSPWVGTAATSAEHTGNSDRNCSLGSCCCSCFCVLFFPFASSIIYALWQLGNWQVRRPRLCSSFPLLCTTHAIDIIIILKLPVIVAASDILPACLLASLPPMITSCQLPPVCADSTTVGRRHTADTVVVM